ncbi:helix-turn-helix domain-containing protein [Phenylobacterium sp. LjRoot219]|uniref:helix-turn-helix domain-containing protein n=1 Tax=Phenylobacterium sp. LjRoot219 TaxID=3342283 RepID=UPI003ECEC6F4
MGLAGNARPRAEAGKAVYARRLVQVLEFFDAYRQPATVNLIAAQHHWPQSSTSDLLAVLVECGLLYKDEETGAFRPSPRAALLAAPAQPPMLREGRLASLMDHLAVETGLSVALVGRVGRDAQIFGWSEAAGPTPAPWPGRLSPGRKCPLHESAAGWLLLSTLGPSRSDAILHRLRGEAPAEQKFNPSAIGARVQACARQRHVLGPAGFGALLDFCGVLTPGAPDDQPLVIGVAFDKSSVSPTVLLPVLQSAVHDWLDDEGAGLNAVRAAARFAA